MEKSQCIKSSQRWSMVTHNSKQMLISMHDWGSYRMNPTLLKEVENQGFCRQLQHQSTSRLLSAGPHDLFSITQLSVLMWSFFQSDCWKGHLESVQMIQFWIQIKSDPWKRIIWADLSIVNLVECWTNNLRHSKYDIVSFVSSFPRKRYEDNIKCKSIITPKS